MNQHGFTLIELIIIIVVLGILAVSAVPIYYNLTSDAKDSAEKAVVGNVREGIRLFFLNIAKSGATPSYPATLDSVGIAIDSAESTPFFTAVLQGGVTEGWRKLSATQYRGPTGATYAYNKTQGSFLKE